MGQQMVSRDLIDQAVVVKRTNNVKIPRLKEQLLILNLSSVRERNSLKLKMNKSQSLLALIILKIGFLRNGHWMNRVNNLRRLKLSSREANSKMNNKILY